MQPLRRRSKRASDRPTQLFLKFFPFSEALRMLSRTLSLSARTCVSGNALEDLAGLVGIAKEQAFMYEQPLGEFLQVSANHGANIKAGPARPECGI
jgi:hypothetical protein